jgi:hypothetical protein
MTGRLGWILVAGGAGCAAAAAPPAAPMAPEQESAVTESAGTLRTDQITLEFASDALRIRVTPLAPELLRLTAPDTRRRLEALAATQRERVGPAVSGEHSLMLVSFRSTAAESRFSPESLLVEAEGQRLRAARILPLTPGWGEQRLHPQNAEAAVYLFERSISPFRPFTVRYGQEQSDGWRAVIPLLEQELARLRSER